MLFIMPALTTGGHGALEIRLMWLEGLDFQFYSSNLNLDSHMWPVAAVLDRSGLEHVKERAVRKGFHGVGCRLSVVPFLLGFLHGSELRG